MLDVARDTFLRSYCLLTHFCQGCIEKWLRMGRKDCPECRVPVKTRRSFMRDLRCDALVQQAAILPPMATLTTTTLLTVATLTTTTITVATLTMATLLTVATLTTATLLTMATLTVAPLLTLAILTMAAPHRVQRRPIGPQPR